MIVECKRYVSGRSDHKIGHKEEEAIVRKRDAMYEQWELDGLFNSK